MGRPENAENGVKSFDFLNRSELPLVSPPSHCSPIKKVKRFGPILPTPSSRWRSATITIPRHVLDLSLGQLLEQMLFAMNLGLYRAITLTMWLRRLATNNLGVNAEFQVGVPSQTLAGFNTAVTNLLNQKIGAMGVEPCGTHGMEYGATCYF